MCKMYKYTSCTCHVLHVDARYVKNVCVHIMFISKNNETYCDFKAYHNCNVMIEGHTIS